jgi:heat-inducible transcriptional repressor
VLSGDPVGSRKLAKNEKYNYSAATIRNVMADLEEKGFLDHPHTSAGRIPTTKGYRHYVDKLISLTKLSKPEQELIIENLAKQDNEVNNILEKTSQILAKVSNQLGVILTPKLYKGVLEHIDIISISSSNVLIVLKIKNGIARTIVLEVEHEISINQLNKVISILNERIVGLTLEEIKNTFHKRVKDFVEEKSGLIRLFIDSADKIFNFKKFSDIKYTGTKNIINNPEFADVNKFSALVELLEEKDIIIHLMEDRDVPPQLKITIGNENREKYIQDCSLVTAPYKYGDVSGILGVIGPTRMSYKKIIPLVDYTAKIVSKMLETENR